MSAWFWAVWVKFWGLEVWIGFGLSELGFGTWISFRLVWIGVGVFGVGFGPWMGFGLVWISIGLCGLDFGSWIGLVLSCVGWVLGIGSVFGAVWIGFWALG